MSEGQIVAIGGAALDVENGSVALERYVLDLTGKERPRVCFVPTASGDDVNYVARFFATYAELGVEAGVLRFFRRTPEDLRAFLFAFDAVHVGGGNTRSMLATWRHWGFDLVVREAWQRGIVLCGSSAGSICWFEEGLTDSVAGDLTKMECLGFLPGSNCPHYDGERDRRPFYQRLIAAGTMRDGVACDDGAGAHFVGRTVLRYVSARPGARAYRVERTAAGVRETPLEVNSL